MKMAIIGYGGMGNCHRQHIIKRLNDSNYPEKLEIAGIYDTNPARVDFAKSLGFHAFNSADEIWNDKDIKLVLVSTPNDSHCEYVVKAAECGKNIIVEKPAAMNSEETAKMYEATEKAGVVFSPHQNRRWDSDFLTAKNIVDNGCIGRVYRVESRVLGCNGIPGAWRKKASQGGGMMLDWGVHLIDQALLMFDEPVVSVYSTYSFEQGEDVDDAFNLEITFKSGVIYQIVVETNTFLPLPRWRVYGVNGTGEVTDWELNGRIVRVKQREDDKLQVVTAGNGFTRTMAKRREETQEELPLEIIRGDGNAFYSNFMDAILKGTPTTVQKRQVMRVFGVMEAAKESARLGQAIIKEI